MAGLEVRGAEFTPDGAVAQPARAGASPRESRLLRIAKGGRPMESVVHRRLMDLEPEVLNPKMIRRFLWGTRIMAALLEFKQGAVVPTHQHENEQLTYVLSGLMRFTLPEGELLLRPGEVLLIPGGTPHGAEMPEDTVELDVFSPPRQDWIDKTDAYLRR